jgi:hypothetical protein
MTVYADVSCVTTLINHQSRNNIRPSHSLFPYSPPELMPMSPVCSIGPIYAIHSVGPIYTIRSTVSSLLVSPLPLFSPSPLLFQFVQKNLPPAFRTHLVQRTYIRTAILSQTLLFVVLFIPALARGVEISDCKAIDDLFLHVAANDPVDCAPHAHLLCCVA